jgi:hypothetical protein
MRFIRLECQPARMNAKSTCGMLKIIIGVTMIWVAVDTASLDAAVAWPKWLLVPVFLGFGFGFFASALRPDRRAERQI